MLWEFWRGLIDQNPVGLGVDTAARKLGKDGAY
jgi:predicted solute-binding protein